MKKKKSKERKVYPESSHKRQHVCLTPKQVKTILSSLRSTAGLRSTEGEREYHRKVMAEIERQVAV